MKTYNGYTLPEIEAITHLLCVVAAYVDTYGDLPDVTWWVRDNFPAVFGS